MGQSAEGHEECAIAAQDVHHRRRWGRRGFAEESTIRQQESQHHQAEDADNKKDPTPAERGLEERAEGRAERRAAGHRAEEPSKRPASPLVRINLSDQRESQWDHAARAEAAHESNRDELPYRACRGRQPREEHEGGERSQHDSPASKPIREDAVYECGNAIGNEIGRDNQADRLRRNAENCREPRDQRRHHVGLEEDQKGRGREEPDEPLPAHFVQRGGRGDRLLGGGPGASSPEQATHP